MSCLLTVTLHIVDVRLTHLINITYLLTYLTRTALNRAHISAKTADVAKLLLLNKHRVTLFFHAEYGDVPTYINLTVALT